MASNNTTVKICFLVPLGLIFITLKLCNVIQWSWWWVLSPLWIPFALILIAFIAIGIVFSVAALLDYNERRKRN